MTGWTARALARLTGVPAPTVTSWIASGLVTPEHMGRGRGGHLIGVSGLMELLTVIELRNAGLSLRDIRRSVEHLRAMAEEPRPLARLSLVVSGSDIAWRDDSEVSTVAVSALRKPGQRLMVFPMGEKHAELAKLLEAPNVQGLALDRSLPEADAIAGSQASQPIL